VATKGHLHHLDGLRGVAALWVVLYHTWTGGHIDNLFAALPDWFATLVFELGWLGVPVFFMLSGFVIPRSQARKADRDFSPLNFMHRRWRRLSPPYYAAIALTIVVGLAEEQIRDVIFDLPSVLDVAAHLAYLQDLTDRPRIGVFFWTLAVEMQFYIMFALMKWVAGRVSWTHASNALLGSALVFSLAWPFGLTEWGDSRGFFASSWFLFLAGQALFESTRDARWRLPSLAYVAALVVAMFVNSDDRVAAGAVTALLLALFIYVDNSPPERLLSTVPAQFLGRISYSLYLIHPAVAGGSFFVAFKVLDPSTATEAIALVAVTIGQIIAAIVFHRLTEQPSITWSRKLRQL